MTKIFTEKTAVVLFNLGGPDKLSSVENFLFNLFNDKAIISLWQPFRFLLAKLISKRRAPKAAKVYESIGGKSPLLDNTLHQLHALERELSFRGNFKVFISMRYFSPRASDAIKEILKYQPTKIILLPLYPQFSSATTASSVEDFFSKFSYISKRENQNPEIKIICCYPENHSFIDAHASLIKQSLAKFSDKKLSDFRFLFSAHGLPQKLIDQGDPYVFQVKKTVDKVVEEMKKNLNFGDEKIDFAICYQSKVGPLKWTSPSLEYEIKRVAIDKKIPVIIPIAFVCDHIETLAELDIEYKHLADQLGVKDYLRIPALNSHASYIKALADICTNSCDDYGCVSNDSSNKVCSKKFKFCPNSISSRA